MQNLAQQFHVLTAVQKRLVHIRLCEQALVKWRDYVRQRGWRIAYVESVVGSAQQVDIKLPEDALASARSGADMFGVASRYREPIVAMQDSDLEFPEQITYAYYSLYNLFQRYVERKAIDDWLIVNQAISAEIDAVKWGAKLEDAMEYATTATS